MNDPLLSLKDALQLEMERRIKADKPFSLTAWELVIEELEKKPEPAA